VIDTAPFRRISQTAPQPVALAAGRVARASTAVEAVDAIRRAAEVLTRFVAIAAVSSVATEGDSGGAFAPREGDASGKALAWGYFLDLARRARTRSDGHVLRPALVKGLGLRPGADPVGLDPLAAILEFRNHRSDHALSALNEQTARGVLEDEQLEQKLLAAVEAFGPLLSLPLVVVRATRRRGRTTEWNCLRFNGELEPFPCWVPGEFSGELEVPYLLFGSALVSLAPALVWQPCRAGDEHTFLFLDQLDRTRCRYRSLNERASVELPVGDSLDPLAWLTGDPQPPESFTARDQALGVYLRSSGDADPSPTTVSPEELPAGPDTGSEERSSNDAPNSSSGKYQRKTLEELRAVAAECGLGDQFARVMDAAERSGLLPVPFTHGVMVAPPGRPGRYLMWVKIVRTKDPYLKVSVGADAFEEHLGVDARRVAEVLEAQYRIGVGDSVDGITSVLDELHVAPEVVR